MEQKIYPLAQPTSQTVFRNEWTLQLQTLEKTIGFMNQQLEMALLQLQPTDEEHEAWLDFCKSETPLIVQEAEDAIGMLRLLSDPRSHCDQA